MRYSANLTGGSLKLAESRAVAGFLLEHGDDKVAWKSAIGKENMLKAKNAATAIRIGRIIKDRLVLTMPELWKMVYEGDSILATHALLAAAIKHSYLLGDFMDLVVREQRRIFAKQLSNAVWEEYLKLCRARDPALKDWNECTKRRIRSTVFQVLAQAGYIDNTRNLCLQVVHISAQVEKYLRENNEAYVLRCVEVMA